MLLWRNGRVRRGQDAATSLGLYFADLIDERRRHPRDDFLSTLIAIEDDGDRLSATELVAMAVLLLLGGHETVANLTANGMLTLLRHPDQLDRLRTDPTLAKSAVDELLRYETSVHMAVRAAGDDIELERATVRRGETVLVVLAAANRDPARFPEPDRFDVARHPNPHLGFAAGIHYCIGAQLARLETQIALTTLLERLPGVRLATDRPDWRDTIALRGLESLPLVFDAEQRATTSVS
jgi:cytochrome P450